MVYQDYDDDDHQHGTFDVEPAGPESVGQVGGGRAKSSSLIMRKKFCGVPIVLVGGLFLTGILGIALVASQTSSSDDDDNDHKIKGSASENDVHFTFAPTPARTGHPTSPPKASVPTPAPSMWPTHETLTADTNWIQVGNDIGGIESAQGNTGISVGVSYDGQVFAEGTHDAVSGEAETGHVRVYKYNQNKHLWEQRGRELLGAKHGDEFGYAIDLSLSGDQIVIGSPGADRHLGPDYGYFSVHRWNETIKDWSPMGPDKWGEMSNERSGHDVCMSETGELLVVGAPGNVHNGKDAGSVRVFAFAHVYQRWLRHGQDIHGEQAGDQFGSSVAVSHDGDVVAAGAPYSNDDYEQAGHIRVFRFVSMNEGEHPKYHKWGRTLYGTQAGGNYGYSVAMSGDGRIVAGGAPAATVDGKVDCGYVDIWTFRDEEGKWHRLGHTIYGQHAGEGFGKSVELSTDGKTLVVGAPDKHESRGAIRVYKYNEEASTWEQMGEDIDGDGSYDYWGSQVASSGDGRILVSGGNNYEGLELGHAHVRVYRGV